MRSIYLTALSDVAVMTHLAPLRRLIVEPAVIISVMVSVVVSALASAGPYGPPAKTIVFVSLHNLSFLVLVLADYNHYFSEKQI